MALTLTSLSACSSQNEPQTAYDSSVDVPLSGWTSADTLFYDIVVTESATIKNPIQVSYPYAIDLSLRHSSSYPFTQLPLHLLMQQTDTTGGYLHPIRNLLRQELTPTMRDTIGQPIGNSWGSLIQLDIPLSDLTIRFDTTGTYRFLIIPETGQYSTLPGIASISLRLREKK